jgi:hypothetical protein
MCLKYPVGVFRVIKITMDTEEARNTAPVYNSFYDAIAAKPAIKKTRVIGLLYNRFEA